MGAKITPETAGLVEALKADMEAARRDGASTKMLAAEMGRSNSWASEMLRGEQPFPLAKLDVWARLTGGRHLARWVADTCGYDLAEREDIDVETTALAAMGESAQALQAASRALLDGSVSADEVAAYQREMQEAIEKFHGLDRSLQARMKRQRSGSGAGTMAEAEAMRGK
jgi:hypothetical protein